MRRWTVRLGLIALLGLACTPLFSGEASVFRNRQDVLKKLDVFSDAVLLIQKNYVQDVSFERLLEGALKGLLSALDPFSQYLDKQSYQDLENMNRGEFDGLGLQLTMRAGHLWVIAPVEGSPADKAGIRAGDTILSIDDFPTKDVTLQEAIKRIKGPAGSRVNLRVLREGDSQIHEFDIERGAVRIESVRESRMIGNVAYVRLAAFQEKSMVDLGRTLKDLRDQEKASALILDLRNNAGGLLSAAVETAELFVPDKKLIVYTQGKNDKEVQYFSSGKEVFSFNPLVILINKGSASGSEILAGAVQDHALGVVMGEKSFGKASVQKLFPIGDGSALRMTSSYYFTPNGRQIHEKGITPDLEVRDTRATSPEQDEILEAAIEYTKANAHV